MRRMNKLIVTLSIFTAVSNGAMDLGIAKGMIDEKIDKDIIVLIAVL